MSADASRGGGLRPLGASLETWTPGRGRGADPLHVITAAWVRIVGPEVASNSSPLELSGQTLVVGTRSSAWSQQLQFLSVHVLGGIRALPCGVAVERLTFRTGLRARARRRSPSTAPLGARRPRARDDGEDSPASDVFAAFERLRTRMSAAARAAVATCATCDAALETRPPPGVRGRCAPCGGAAERERRTLVERSVYMAPWLTLGDLREQIPDLRVAEFEGVRRGLLARWWLALQRARLAGCVSPSGVERHVASSYVLLQSRLPPDRVTPAVVRNLLGADLEKVLWAHPSDVENHVR